MKPSAKSDFDWEPHLDRVYRFALSLTGNSHAAEDLTQECFLRAHARLEQLEKPKSVRAWLFQITINLWRDEMRKKRIDMTSADEAEPAGKGKRPDQLSIEREDVAKVIREMNSLPERQRTVMFLRSVEQMKIEEIAKVLKMSGNSVKANLSIARKSLRSRLMLEKTRSSK